MLIQIHKIQLYFQQNKHWQKKNWFSIRQVENWKHGQSNPFDETAVTGVLYDAEGNAYYKTVTSKNEGQTNCTWYGTVSGNSASPTTSTVPTVPTNTPVPTVTPTPVATPTTTPNQTYNPDTDITAPSSDSGNLSQPTGKK